MKGAVSKEKETISMHNDRAGNSSGASLPDHSTTSPPQIPDYELFRCIGVGSYGEVWLARSVLSEYRAVKVVYRSKFEHDRPYEREFQGIKNYEPISRTHESQVDILHVGRNDQAGYFYYVMELADDANGMKKEECRMQNDQTARSATAISSFSLHPSALAQYAPRTLKSELTKHGRLTFDRCVEIGLALTTALEHIHGHGLVHRDVKPSNIIFVNGVPKLADVGLVTGAGEACSLVGTEGYMAPEGPGTAKADLYSLGKVLYEISMGRKGQAFPELPADWDELADKERLLELNEIILKACQGNLDLRYKSAAEMRAEIELLQTGHSVKRKRALGRRWHLAKNIALAVIVLGLVGGSAIFALRELNRNRPLSSNPKALKLYVQAEYVCQRQTLEGVLQAFTNLTEAVELDPQFVDAYFKLGELNIRGWADQLPPHQNMLANFRWAADKIRRLDPNSAQYHTLNSFIKGEEWHFDQAIEEITLARRLDPKFRRAAAHVFCGVLMLHARGDAETALREFRTAERIDSASVGIQNQLGIAYYFMRDFPKAIEQYQKASQLEPRRSGPHWLLGRAYEADKQYDKALAEYEAEEKLDSGDVAKTEAKFLRYRSALSEMGPREMWQAMLDYARQSPWPDHYGMARLCARLGYANEVFLLLNQAYQEHNRDMLNLLIDDCWGTLRDDARYNELLGKIGFSKVLPARK